MRKTRGQKIKRYRRSFTGKAERSLIIRRVLGFVVLLAALFGIGWLVAEPAINMATGLWYSIKNSFAQNDVASSSQPQSTSIAVSQPESKSESALSPQPVEELQSADGNWAYVAFSAIDTPEKAAETAKDLAAQGIKCAVMQLKDERGYIYYQSAVALAKQQIADKTLDAAQIAKTFSDNGIIPIAGIYAFKDGLASKSERSAAVTYNGQEGYLWLDNKPELGGASWLSPYSQTAKQYISDIISEILSFGFKQIVVSGAQYPDGYGLETAVFSLPEDNRTKQQALTDCITAWQELTKNSDARLWLHYTIEAALDDNNKKTYGSPFALGAEGLLIDFSSSVQQTETGSILNHELFGAAASKASNHGNPKLAMTMGSGLLQSDAVYSAAAAAKDSGFVSFVVK